MPSLISSGLVDELTPEQLAALTLLLRKEAASPENNRTEDHEIVPAPREGGLPLSFAQQRLWFIDQLEPGEAMYNIPATLRVRGELRREPLERALGEVVRRHEVLRTRFEVRDNQPAQLIDEAMTMEAQLIDLSILDERLREGEASRIAKEEAARGFNLSQGPLIRARLMRLGDQDQIVLLTMHHIISDGWSMRVLVREVSALCDAFAKGEASPLPELPIQYADYAVWQQRQWLQAGALERQIRYWKDQLEGVEALELPTDWPRAAVQSYQGGSESLALGAELTNSIREVSRREGVTVFMLLLAAFKILLYRYSGQERIVVGAPIAGRNRVELEPLIGLFVNMLAIKTDLSGAHSLREIIRREREAALGAYAHQDVSFEKVVEELQPQRNLSRHPVFQVMFVLQTMEERAEGIGRLGMMPMAVESGTAKFDLSLRVTESREGMIAGMEYRTDLFNGQRIKRMLKHLKMVLGQMTGDAELRVSELKMLSAGEEHQLLFEWNRAASEYPSDKHIHELFEEQIERASEAIALIDENQYISYRELNGRANQLAHYLRRMGVGPDVLVGVMIERSIEMVVGMLGVLKAGGAYVPLDPTYPPARLALMIDDARVRVLLTQSNLVENLRVETEVVCLDSEWSQISQQSRENCICEMTALNLAYVIYTSGSTGGPKGVMAVHQAALNRFNWMWEQYPFHPQDICCQKTSVSFVDSVWEIFGALLQAIPIIIVPDHLVKDTGRLADFLSLNRVTRFVLVPSLLESLLSAQANSTERLSGLNLWISSGEALSVQLIRKFRKVLPKNRLLNLYGSSEVSADVTAYEVKEEESSSENVALGHPINNLQVHLLDRDMGLAPMGVEGEIHVGGAGLARGYLNRGDLTAERFIPHPWSEQPGARLYRTGDRGRYLPDGNLQYLGRIDQQAKIRGYRIEPREIEAVLEQHASVRQAVVTAWQVTTTEKWLVAYLVSAREQAPTAGDLRRYLREKLPEYMVPSAFVLLDDLPLTPNGKVDRRALPDPETGRSLMVDNYVAPRSPIEEILAGRWAEVLKLEQVGIHDNFFDLGGHSLLATQLVSRIREDFGIELPLRTLFEKPRIDALSASIQAALSQGRTGSASRLRAVSREFDLPLSHAQQRLWFLDQLEPGGSMYNIPSALRVSGDLKGELLGRVLSEVTRRHEVLRTRFEVRDGQPKQVIEEARSVAVPVVDVSGLEERQREVEASRIVSGEAARGFDLSRGPLLRAGLVRLGAREQIMLLTMHHIVSDGWSMGVLIREVSALYEAYSKGEASPLPELPIQYVDFAVWQRGWLQGGELERQIGYWKDQLAGVEALELPADFPRPTVQSFRGSTQRFILNPETLQQLKALGQNEGATLFMVLLGGFQLLLGRYSGQTDVVVGTPVANRERSELEGLIGFFVNTLVLRTEVGGDPSVRELMKRVREVCVGAYGHQELPFEKLVEQLQPERDLSRQPLVQVMFALQNAPREALEMPGLSLRAMGGETKTTKFDLTLSMTETDRGLIGSITHCSDLFTAERIQRMAGHFQRLMESMAGDAERRISELRVLSEQEEHQLLWEWNQTAREYGSEKHIHQLFEEQVERTPEAIAVVYEDQQVSYQELNTRANQLAHLLRRIGVGSEVIVGLCLERSVEMVVGIMGVLKAGGAYLPLDSEYPPERLSFMLEDAGVRVVVMQQSVGERQPTFREQTVLLDKEWERISGENENEPESQVVADNPAYVIYTSGSTGRPKGVVVHHRNLVNYTLHISQHLGVLDGESKHGLRFATVSTMTADLGNTCIYPSLVSGGCLHILSYEVVTDGARFENYLRRNPIDVLKIVPSHLGALLGAQLAGEGILPYRYLILGGEVLSYELVERIRERNQRCKVINHYGPTETTIGSLTASVSEEKDRRRIHGRVPIGRPISNTEVYILDREFTLVPVGARGELYIAGVGVARGYLGRPELTAEKFIPHLLSSRDGERLYKTGDVCRYLSDGSIEFLGRVDEQVKVRGYRIEPGEIEAALEQHPSVRQAVVITREEAREKRRLIAYLVGDPAQVPSDSELRHFLKARLPEYLVPSTFMALDEFPLTPNGKVNRRALPTPELSRCESDEDYLAPRNPVEETLARIWSGVLGLERVGIHDNFFELGGDSILSIQIIARARQAGLELTPKHIFRHQTIAQLAQLTSAASEQRPLTDQAPVSGGLPLTPIQHWFFAQQPVEPDHYNQSVLLRVETRLEVGFLARVVKQLLTHHDGLRLRFAHTTEGWRQFNAAVELNQVFSINDLEGVAPEQQSRLIEEAADQAQRSLKLSEGPLVRVVYFDCGGERAGRLLMVIHHLAVDGVSWRILLEDLQRGYEQLQAGESIRLPAKTSSFKQWAERMSAEVEAGHFDRELSYWTSLPAVKPLPVDHEGERAYLAETERVVVSRLSREQTQALLQEVPGVYYTQVNDVLLTCLGQVLSRWTGARRVMVDLEGHGREQVEALEKNVDISRTVGWFTTIFPVVLDLGPAESGIGDELKRVKEQLRAIPGRGIGYGWLKYVRSGEVGERMRQLAEAEVRFNYLGQVDQALEKGTIFSGASESGGASRSEKGNRSHKLIINAIVQGGRLVLRWNYSQEAHERHTIEELASRFEEAVDRVIEHCREPEAGGHTPSDFPLARLTQEEVDRLVSADREVEGVYRLSSLQQGLLFHTLYEPGSGQYFEQLSCRLRKLEVGAFRKAWAAVVKRHPILRTSFHWEGLNETVQVVHRQVEVPWEEQDWRPLSDWERSEQLKRYLEENQQRVLLLDQAPLMRMELIKVDEDSYYFIWNHHHLLLDGWSASLVIKEVFVYYEAYRNGREVALEQPRAYIEYIEWLERQDQEKAESFWRRALEGFQSPTRLRVGDKQGASGGHQSQRIMLGEEMSERLRAGMRSHQLTLNTVVQGAWAVLLSRYSGEADVVFGVTVSGRGVGLIGIESMVGLFINTLPVRVRVGGEQAVSGWLKQLQEEQVEARQYEYSSLAKVLKWSEIGADEKLFESLLVYENYPVDRMMLKEARQSTGIEVEEMRTEERTNYPLTVVAWTTQRMELRLDYHLQFYDEVEIERMVGHLRNLLESFAVNAEQRVAELQMLSDKEKHQLLAEWNRTAREYPFENCIHQLFEEQVEKAPDAIAVVYEGEQISYSQLNRRANQLAHYLLDRGVGSEVLVGICVERSLEMIVGLLGILKAGGAFVPIEPDCPRQRLKLMLSDSQAHLLLTQRPLFEDLSGITTQIICLDSDWDTISLQDSSNIDAAADPDNPAYVIYTSGSTGQPKGVIVTHYNLVRLLHGTNSLFWFDRNDVWTLLHSYAFDFSVWEMWGALGYGGRLIVAPQWLSRSSEAVSELLDKEQVSILNQTPTAFRGLANIQREEGQAVGRNLRRIIFGGEAIDSASVGEWMESRGSENPLLVNMYGITETTVHVTYWLVRESEVSGGRSSIGRPITDLRVYILDRHLVPAPVGVPGEIYVGGGGVARGYLKREDLTGERFIPDPYSGKAGARVYKTGDLGRYKADGEIEHLGRIDNQVKVRGYRIELGEIEVALKQHSAVREALVLAADAGTKHKRLVAYIVIDDEASPADHELRRYLQERLPEYMVPAWYVKLERLPLTANGKVDKRALPQPEGAGRELAKSYREPRTEMEKAMAEIWGQVLGVDRVGTEDNFFDLGGDSILSIRVVSRANQAGIKVTPRQIFQHQTIAELAKIAAMAIEVEADRSEIQGIVPLTPTQQSFFEREVPNRDRFSQSMMLRVGPMVEPDKLRLVVHQLVEHHDALRMRYSQKENGWEQRNAVAKDNEIFSRIDLSGVEKERCDEVIESAAEQIQRSLTLSDGPLVRAVYYSADAGTGNVLLVAHHLVVDRVSWRILLEDLQRGYEQVAKGEPIDFGEKTASFKKWAEKLWEYANSEELRAELSYWESLPDVKEDRKRTIPGTRYTAASSRSITVKLSKEQTIALLQEVDEVYHTQINELLLTGLARAARRWRGRGRLVVDVGRDGREALFEGIDVRRTVGWFTIVYPVEIDLGREEKIGEQIKQVKEQLRKVPRRGIGYGILRYLRGGQNGHDLGQKRGDIRFNYLGQFDQVLKDGGRFSPAKESRGEEVSKLLVRDNPLEINSRVIEGRLEIALEYSEQDYTAERVEELALRYRESLEEIIAHCKSDGAGGYTPSDFPDSGLSQNALDQLIEEISEACK